MSEQRGPFEKSIDLSKVGPPPGRVNPAPKRVEGRHEDNDGIALARMRAEVEKIEKEATAVRPGMKCWPPETIWQHHWTCAVWDDPIRNGCDCCVKRSEREEVVTALEGQK